MRRLAPSILAGLVAALGACVTPSIPIPPPEPSSMTFAVTLDGAGQIDSASLTYPPTDTYRGGIAYVYNRIGGVGIIEDVKPDGSIGPTAALAARAGDSLVVTVEVEDQTVSTCVLLREGTPSSVCN